MEVINVINISKLYVTAIFFSTPAIPSREWAGEVTVFSPQTIIPDAKRLFLKYFRKIDGGFDSRFPEKNLYPTKSNELDTLEIVGDLTCRGRYS